MNLLPFSRRMSARRVRPYGWRVALAACLLALAGAVAAQPSASQTATPQAAPAAAAPGQSDFVPIPTPETPVRTTILRGRPAPPAPPPAPRGPAPGGDVSLNYPSVDVQAVAKAVLGDILNVKYTVDPSIHGVVTIQTARAIHRSEILPLFEESLRAANLALTYKGGVYQIIPVSTAPGESGVLGPADTGFGTETMTLKYASAAEVKKVIDPIVPNAISQADTTRNVLVVVGTTAQRKTVRDLVQQFDVDWLRGMSFAVFIPQRTDARLIAPELDKLINGPGAQTAGLVRLITMDQLNGILAIANQPQLLDDVRRFVEVLDREGQSSEKRIFVYHVQNGRAADLANVLAGAFGIAVHDVGATSGETTADATDRTSGIASPFSGSSPAQAGVPMGGLTPGIVPQQNNQIGREEAAANKAKEEANNASPGSGEPNGTTITADENNNAIVVFAAPREFALMEDALRRLDVPPLQVFIDAMVSEVTLNNNLQYGIQWYFTTQGNTAQMNLSPPVTTTDPVTGATTSTIPVPPVPILPGFSYLYQTANVTATLNALRAVTDVHVLSAPKLMVLNNHTASIEVGDQVPISTSSSVGTEVAGAPQINSIEYQQTGVILKVTPRVNAGGLVLLDISQEVSDVSTTTSSSLDSPTISVRKISTSVAVQDGETVALGGLIKNETTKSKSVIPLLGDIPYIGHLFGSTGNVLARTELLVLLTPRVVRTQIDADAIVRELKAKIQLAEPPPPPPPPPKDPAPKPFIPAGIVHAP